MSEKEAFSKLTKGQKRRLERFECAWCNHRLDQLGCSAIYDKCPVETRITRMNKALEGYKPRKTPHES